jgi:hypothetical protein
MLRARQTEVRHDDRNQGDDEGLLAEQDAASCSRFRCRSLSLKDQEAPDRRLRRSATGAVPAHRPETMAEQKDQRRLP